MIGVSSSEIRRPKANTWKPHSEPRGHELALGFDYLLSIEEAGGIPVILPPLIDEQIHPLLDRLDGLCLSGGPDLAPSYYQAEPHPELGPTEPEIDRFELAAIGEADARDLPLLCICRGTQALNIARGGDLHQHLPDIYGTEITHRQKKIGSKTIHSVDVLPDTRLAGITGPGEVEVNSFHHQAIDQLGGELRVVARAPDGVIEAVEGPGERFVVGVQWHAESLTAMDEHAALFSGLVAAAGGRLGRRSVEA